MGHRHKSRVFIDLLKSFLEIGLEWVDAIVNCKYYRNCLCLNICGQPLGMVCWVRAVTINDYSTLHVC